MKIRLKGDSIRFRLGPGDVALLASKSLITESTRLGPDVTLHFALQLAETGDDIRVVADGMRVRVEVPAAWVRRWAGGDDVGIEAAAINGTRPAILIEKDFECRHDGPDADVYRGKPMTDC